MFRRLDAKAYAGPGGSARSSMGKAVVSLALTALLTMAAAANAQPCPKRCLAGHPNGIEPNDQGKLCSVNADCNLCNPGHPDYEPADCAAAVPLGGMCQARSSCVHLQWSPLTIGVSGPGQIVNLKLKAVSSTGLDQPFEALEAILSWDPSKLRFLGRVDPCTVTDPCTTVCPSNTYKWGSSFFPNDCDEDAINTPCPGNPENDGDAWYVALSRILCGLSDPAPPPVATGAGLHVTTFQFEVLSDVGTSSAVSLLFDRGGITRTRVLGGTSAAEVVTGNFPGNAVISVETCTPPTVLAAGSRVIEIDPGGSTGAVGFRVTSNDPGLTCIDRYAGTNGALGPPAGAAFKTPAQWGNPVLLRGRRIIPDATYKIQKDCGAVGSSNLSTPVQVTMAMWADTDDSRIIDFKDISRFVTGFVGDFAGQDPPLTFADVDVLGPTASLCVPNAVIDFLDIAACVNAFVRFGVPGANAFREIPCDVSFCAGP